MMQSHKVYRVEGHPDMTEVRLERDGRVMYFNVSPEIYITGIRAYEEGALIQHAFPFLSPDEREFLMTGMSSKEWNRVFGNNDE